MINGKTNYLKYLCISILAFGMMELFLTSFPKWIKNTSAILSLDGTWDVCNSVILTSYPFKNCIWHKVFHKNIRAKI